MSNQQGVITFILNKNGLKNGTYNKICIYECCIFVA